jgi:hypothetical protein
MRRKLLLTGSLLIVLGAGALAVQQGRLFWRSLNLAHSPLERLRARFSPPHRRLSRRVVLVILDGMRADRASGLPVLDALRARGAWREVESSFPTISIPQYWAMLSGVEPVLSGARTNGYREFPLPVDNLFRIAHDAGLSLGAFGADTEGPWYPREFSAWFRREHFGESYPQALSASLREPIDLTVVVEDWIDAAGHHGNVSGPAYDEAARKDDADLGQLAALLDFSKDTLIVTADHGHRDEGGHGGDERECMSVPLLAVGAGIVPGSYDRAQLVDVAPTLAALLGLPAPAASHGKPLVDMLRLDANAQSTLLERAARQRQRVETVIAATFDRAASHDDLLRRLRLAGVAIALLAVALGLHRSGVGWTELGAAAAYLLAFVISFHLAGGRLSLSAARTSGFFVRVLLISFFGGGLVWMVVARRLRREHPQLLWLATALLAGVPWLVAMAVVGAHAGLVMPSAPWTAMGAWSGLPLICLGPWLLVDAVVNAGRWLSRKQREEPGRPIAPRSSAPRLPLRPARGQRAA